MSLVNDALKKAQAARAAQSTANPTKTAAPELQPLLTPNRAPKRSIITLPILIGAVVVLAAVLGWVLYFSK
jgi:hypothetical protein